MDEMTERANGFRWTCKLCGFTHKWRLIMSNHLRVFHKLSAPVEQNIIKIGDVPSNAKASDDSLVTHLSIKNFKCKLCDISFETVQDLSDHNEDLHTDLVWACKMCSFSNKWQQLAISHLRSAHYCHPPYTDHLIRRSSDKSLSTTQSIYPIPANFGSHLYHVPQAQQLHPQVQTQRPQHQVQPPPKLPPVRLSTPSPPTPAPAPAPPPPPPSSSTSGVNLLRVQPFKAQNDNRVKDNDQSQDDEYDNNDSESVNDPSPPEPDPPEPKLSLSLQSKDCYRRMVNDKFQCKTCGKTCGSAQGITEHYEAYHLGLNYQCKLCNFTDIWRSMLTKHLKQKHSLGKPYENYLRRIKIEGKTEQDRFAHLNRRRSHLHAGLDAPESISSNKSSRLSTSSSSSALAPAATTNPTVSKSSSVDQNVKSDNTYRHHRSTITNGGKIIISSQIRQRRSKSSELQPDDNKSDSKTKSTNSEDSNEDMDKHYIQLNDQFRCKLCLSNFTSMQGFQEHFEAIHLDVIWVCKKCPVSFRWRQQLTKHLKITHDCDPPFNEHMRKEFGGRKLMEPLPESCVLGRFIFPKNTDPVPKSKAPNPSKEVKEKAVPPAPRRSTSSNETDHPPSRPSHPKKLPASWSKHSNSGCNGITIRDGFQGSRAQLRLASRSVLNCRKKDDEGEEHSNKKVEKFVGSLKSEETRGIKVKSTLVSDDEDKTEEDGDEEEGEDEDEEEENDDETDIDGSEEEEEDEETEPSKPVLRRRSGYPRGRGRSRGRGRGRGRGARSRGCGRGRSQTRTTAVASTTVTTTTKTTTAASTYRRGRGGRGRGKGRGGRGRGRARGNRRRATESESESEHSSDNEGSDYEAEGDVIEPERRTEDSKPSSMPDEGSLTAKP